MLSTTGFEILLETRLKDCLIFAISKSLKLIFEQKKSKSFKYITVDIAIYKAILFWLVEFLLRNQLIILWEFPCMFFVWLKGLSLSWELKADHLCLAKNLDSGSVLVWFVVWILVLFWSSLVSGRAKFRFSLPWRPRVESRNAWVSAGGRRPYRHLWGLLLPSPSSFNLASFPPFEIFEDLRYLCTWIWSSVSL